MYGKIAFIDNKKIPTCIEILNNSFTKPFDLESFINFSKKNFSEENVYLWLDIQIFKKMENKELYTLDKIYNKYLKLNSYMEVNITNIKSIDSRKNIENSITNLETKINEDIFCHIEKEIFYIINNNLYYSFINSIIIKERIQLSKIEALWWKNNITIKRFFSFPDPINEAESRLHNICSSLLFIISFISDRILHFPYLYILLIYGYFTRILCGPKIDPQAFFVLFVLRPIFSDKLKVIPTRFVPSPPKRFSQFIGLCFCILGITLRYIYLFTNNKNSIILCFEYIIWCLFLIASFFAGVLNYCFACEFFKLFIHFNIISKKISSKCKIKYYYDN